MGDPWTLDPEMKVLRDEFVTSFVERRRVLKGILEKLKNRGGEASQELPKELMAEYKMMVHRLAGVARTYGFDQLGEIAENLDDRLDTGIGSVADWINEGEKLARALNSAA